MNLARLRGLAAPASQLAALRVMVSLALLMSPELHAGEANAALDRRLRAVPEGLGWFFAHAPVSAPVARVVHGVFVVAASLTLMGFVARPAALCMTVSAFYLMALAQTSGSVLHDMHLVWFAALLACAPCADAWSLDAWGDPARDFTGRRTSLAYGAPVWAVRALLAAVYFFPGFWKLRTSGLAWIFSDNLAHQMQWKWFESGRVPAWRVDHHPWLMHLGALGAVSFELGFPLLLAHRRTRTLAALAGLAFHWGTGALMGIPFTSLWMCYVALIDWPARWRTPPDTSERTVRATFSLGALMLVACVIQGARGQMQAWPFACYPTFQWVVPGEIPDVRVELIHASGARETLTQPRGRGNDRWAMAWRTAGLYGDAVRSEVLRAYLARVLSDTGRALPNDVTEIRFYKAFYDVRPERYGEAPVREELLGAVTPQAIR